MTASGDKQQRNEVQSTTGRDDARGGTNQEQTPGNPDVVQGEGDYDAAREFNAAEQEFVASGKLRQFELLKPFLSNLPEEGAYAAVASELGMEPGAVAVAVHRLRVRYREIVRSDVAETVTSEEDLKAEMRHLFASLN